MIGLGAVYNIGRHAIDLARAFPAASITAGIVGYFTPMGEVFLVLLVFVGVDLLSGLAASRKKHIPCSSRRGRLSAVKVLSYMLAIMLPYMAERAFNVEWIGSYRFIGGFICLVEFISILENLAVLTEKQTFLNIIKLVRGKAKEKHGTLVDDILSEKNEESLITKDDKIKNNKN